MSRIVELSRRVIKDCLTLLVQRRPPFVHPWHKDFGRRDLMRRDAADWHRRPRADLNNIISSHGALTWHRRRTVTTKTQYVITGEMQQNDTTRRSIHAN
jgi:hypothetical protein